MDTQEAANLATIQNTRLSRWLLFLAIVQVISPFFYYWLNKSASPNAPSGGGVVIPAWLPTAFFVSSFAVTTIALLFVASKRWKNKRLASEISTLHTDLAKAKSDHGAEQRAHQTCVQNYETLEKELRGLEREKRDLAGSLENSRREVAEVRAERDAQTRTYDATFKGMKSQMDTLKRELEEANKRANEARGNHESIYAMFQEKERRLTEVDWLMQLAEDQAKQLSDYIRVEIITDPDCGRLQLTGDDLCVLLVVHITNQSIFEVAIDEKRIRGQFSLNRVAFKEKAGQLIDDFRAPLHNLKHRQQEYIIIEQPLRKFEAEKIERCLADPDAKFWVGGVRIPISINNAGFEVKNEPDLLWGKAADVPLKHFKRNTDN